MAPFGGGARWRWVCLHEYAIPLLFWKEAVHVGGGGLGGGVGDGEKGDEEGDEVEDDVLEARFVKIEWPAILVQERQAVSAVGGRSG